MKSLTTPPYLGGETLMDFFREDILIHLFHDMWHVLRNRTHRVIPVNLFHDLQDTQQGLCQPCKEAYLEYIVSMGFVADSD